MSDPTRQSEAVQASPPSLAHHVSQLLPLNAGLRGEYLQKLEPAMADELAELLAFQSTALDLSHLAGVTVAQELLRREVPPVLGRWQIGRPLGQGGMGSVYLATREELGVVHRGAVKRGHSQIQSAAALAAVQREAGALSELQHGGIARLLDFGSDEQGLPFVVSEYVDGLPLLQYLQQRKPDRAARLELFAQLLDAVAAAHANLVLHLDLKPDNVLVTDAGRVKLIDFGLSGLGGEKPSGFTQAFASPEQLAGQPVTVAADIFALGKVLEQVAEQAPTVTNFELKAIVEMATREQPEQRYPSALALKLDILALAQSKPVTPLQHQRGYRWSRFLRRQWLPVSLSVLTLAVLVAGLASVYQQNQAIEQERDRALDLLASERATSSFVTESLREASVFGGGDGAITVAELMHKMLETLPSDEKMSPRSKSWLASDLAAVFTGLGQMEAALDASQMAVEAAAMSEEIEDDIAHWTQMALTAGVAHRYELALSAAQKAQDIALPVNHWRLPWTYLATMQTQMAMKQWPEVVALFEVIAALPTDRQSVSGNIHYMRGTALANLERFTEAESDFVKARQIYFGVFGEGSAPVADVEFRDFQRLILQGKLADAASRVPHLRTFLHQTYGAEHYRSIVFAAETAWLDYLLGQSTSRLRLDKLLPELIGLLGESSPVVAIHQIRRARMSQGQVVELRTALLRLELAQNRLQTLPPAHPDRLDMLLTRAELLADRAQFSEAKALLTPVLNLLQPLPAANVLKLRAAVLGSRGLMSPPDQSNRCQGVSNQLQDAQAANWDPLVSLGPANRVYFEQMLSLCSNIN